MKSTRIKVTVAAAMILLVGTGCFRHSYTVGAGGDTGREAALSKWQHNLLWGLISGDTVDLNSVCPSGSATVENYFSVMNMIVTTLLGGFWSPTTVEVYCGGARADLGEQSVKHITLSVEEQKRIVQDPRFLILVHTLLPEKLEQVRVALEQRSVPDNALVCR